MRNPDIELLWWAGCPSTDEAQAELEQAVRDVGLSDTRVRRSEIATDEEAKERGFVGSPTILVDGVDVASPEPDEAVGLTCRVYRRRDGRIAPTPDPDDVREALKRAAFAQKEKAR
jgi:predicted Zn-dependent protease